MKIFKWLLFPFAVLYDLITRLRNHLYNIEYYKSFEFQTNVISVGNLTVGGTGKTPMIEYLIRLLRDQYGLATLSRGYGRKTRGFLQGDFDQTKVHDIGDEPFQYLLKFHDKVGIFVGEERAWAIPGILMERPGTEVILLDDAYQHRTVLPSLSILMTRYDRLFSADFLMPMGRLREARKGASRADAVVVSKCPFNFDEKAIIEDIRKYIAPSIPVFFTSVAYGAAMSFWDSSSLVLGGQQV
ncbi:MAG: tetraacyldisaccharide 4'-kinase, partial [Bacteroidota bacterium]